MKLFGLSIGGQSVNKNNLSFDNIEELQEWTKSQAKQAANNAPSGHGRKIGEDVSERDMYSGYIFAAIKKTRNQVADILASSLETYSTKDGNEKTAPALDKKHPYLAIIDNSPTSNIFMYQAMATYMIMYGEVIERTGERTLKNGRMKLPMKFEVVNPATIDKTLYEPGTNNIIGYNIKTPLIGRGGSIRESILATDTIRTIDIDPFELGLTGYGTLLPVKTEFGIEKTSKRLQLSTIVNMIKAPGIVGTKTPLADDEYQNLCKMVEERWSSPDMERAGKPIVTNGGEVTYQSIMEDLDKLAMQKIRSLNRDEFFAALGVSKTILGIEESGTTREVSKVQREQFILDTCMPIVNAYVSGKNQDYINNYPKEYASQPLRIRAIAPIDKDLQEEKTAAEIDKIKADTMNVYLQAGVDPQQAAKLAKLELPDDEEIIIVEEPTQTPDEEIDETPTNKFNSCTHSHTEIKTNALTTEQTDVITNAESTLVSDVESLADDLETYFIEGFNREQNAYTTDEQEKLYTESLEASLMKYAETVVPLYAADRIATVAAQSGDAVFDFVMNDELRDEIRERLRKTATSHFNTNSDVISQAIANAIKDGATDAQVRLAINNIVANDVKGYLLEMLVQTETTNAFNQSTFWADREFINRYDYPKSVKVWQTNSPKPCPFCASIRGDEVPFEDNFFVIGDTVSDPSGKLKPLDIGFTDVSHGGLHPNCRCNYRLELRR